jgi:hypothetical protein
MTDFAERKALHVLSFFAAPDRSRTRVLHDLRYLSDHLKRDLGLLDGNSRVRGSC